MSGTLVLLVVGAAWCGIGLTLAAVLGRRGHDGFSWLVLGALLGPIGAALAAVALRRGEQLDLREVTPPAPAPLLPGAVDVLAGVDGSPEARAAIWSAIELLGDRLGRLTLVHVVPYGASPMEERLAVDLLSEEADRLRWLGPGVEVVHGPPAEALGEAAVAGGYGLLVVGRRGIGRAHLFGSAAAGLARSAPVRVLLGSSDPTAGPATPGLREEQPA